MTKGFRAHWPSVIIFAGQVVLLTSVLVLLIKDVI
jgi:hypothetical protein